MGRYGIAFRNPNSPSPMGHLFLAIFLLVFGLNLLIGVALPGWVLGVLALIAGGLLLAERYGASRRLP